MQAYHTLICGDSGGGKTTLMREHHAEFPGLSIWVNHTDETNIAGKRVRGKRAMMSADRTTLNLLCDDVNEGCRIAREFGREYFEATGYPFQVLVDEAQEKALPDGSSVPDTPLKRGLHQDRDHGGKWVVASQDPTDLHYTPLKQCRYFVWVGGWSTWHKGFIQYWDLPQADLPDRPYQYVTMDKRMNVIHEGETKKKYA